MCKFLAIFLSIWLVACSSGSNAPAVQSKKSPQGKFSPSPQSLSNEQTASVNGAYLQEYLNFNTNSDNELCQTVSQFFQASISNFPTGSSRVIECKNNKTSLECKGSSAQYLGSVDKDGQYTLQIEKNTRIILSQTLEKFLEENELDEEVTFSKIKDDSWAGKFPKTQSEAGKEEFTFEISHAEEPSIQCLIKAEYNLKTLDEEELLTLKTQTDSENNTETFSGFYHVIYSSGPKTESKHPMCQYSNIFLNQGDTDNNEVVDVFQCKQNGSNIECSSDNHDNPIKGALSSAGRFQMTFDADESNNEEGMSMQPFSYTGTFPELGQESQMQGKTTLSYEMSTEDWTKVVAELKQEEETLRNRGYSDEFINELTSLDPNELNRVDCAVTADFKLKKFNVKEIFQYKVRYRQYDQPLTYQLKVLSADKSQDSPCTDINTHLNLAPQQSIKFDCPQGSTGLCTGFGSPYEFEIFTLYDNPISFEVNDFSYEPEEKISINGNNWTVYLRLFYPLDDEGPQTNKPHIIRVGGHYTNDQNQTQRCSSQFEVEFKIIH